GAGMPGEEQHLARGDVETDLGERDAPTGILLADAVETQDGHGGGVSQNCMRGTGPRAGFATTLTKPRTPRSRATMPATTCRDASRSTRRGTRLRPVAIPRKGGRDALAGHARPGGGAERGNGVATGTPRP